MNKSRHTDEFIARQADQAGEVYATEAPYDRRYNEPNYGRNAATGGSTASKLGDARVRPTLGAVTDICGKLHGRLSELEEALRSVHSRIGAENGPEVSPEKPGEYMGPVDDVFYHISDAIRRVENFKTMVETISARI